MTQSRNNQIILAAAGSGKTTLLVDEALRDPSRRVLFTTYTLENVAQIEEYIVKRHGCIPPNVTVMSWYTVLLRDGVRPFQRTLFPDAPRVVSIHFDRVPYTIGRPKKTEVRYYLTKAGLIYRDRMSAFAVEATAASKGALINRLEDIYDLVIIDELQDMAGYDLDMLELLFKSRVAMHCCGDLRQATYATNDHSKNKQFRKRDMIKWIRPLENAGLISVGERNLSFRCNPQICAFANAIFPELPPCESSNSDRTAHDGIFFVQTDEVARYVATHSPKVLRYNSKTDALGLTAMTFGSSKGRTFDRVLILPTNKIKKYLKSKRPEDIGDREKFYVAVTRARHSVAIVV